MAIKVTLTLKNRRYPVLRCRYGFHRPVDSNGCPKGGMQAGQILLEMESTSDTLALESLFLRTPRSVAGRIDFTDEDELTTLRSLEWEEGYIYGVGERLCGGSCLPMLQSVAITPLRLDINGHIRLDRRFPQTYGFWWQACVPEAAVALYRGEPEQQEVLVRTVDGPDRGYAHQVLLYRVTGYNLYPSDADRSAVRWRLEVGGEQLELDQTGETLELRPRREWVGRQLTVMPYLREPTAEVSAVSSIERFRTFFFARSAKWAGRNLDGSIAEDMLCGDKTAEEVARIHRFFSFQLSASDDELFADMYALARMFTLQRGWENAKAVIDHFRSNRGTTFSSAYMDNELKNHATFREFVYGKEGDDGPGVLKLLCDRLRDFNGDLSRVAHQVGEIGSTRVKFNTRRDHLNGMTICVDDTSAYHVYVDDYELLPDNRFNCRLRFEIYDHYGLDRQDVETYGLGAGFRAWYVLQHVRGYQPFLTRMNATLTLTNQSFIL